MADADRTRFLAAVDGAADYREAALFRFDFQQDGSEEVVALRGLLPNWHGGYVNVFTPTDHGGFVPELSVEKNIMAFPPEKLECLRFPSKPPILVIACLSGGSGGFGTTLLIHAGAQGLRVYDTENISDYPLSWVQTPQGPTARSRHFVSSDLPMEQRYSYRYHRWDWASERVVDESKPATE